MVLMLTGCEQSSDKHVDRVTERKKASNAETIESVNLPQEGLNVQLAYGMNGTARYDRYTAVTAVMQNYIEDFAGYLQVVLAGEEESHTFRRDFLLKKGESQRVPLYFPACMDRDEFEFSIHAENGAEIYSNRVAVKVDYGTDAVYMGIYSDRVRKLGYLDGRDSRVFYLKRTDFAGDYKALDIFDMLVVSDKDMRDLTKRQIRALAAWVKRGGSLVLADGGNEWEFAPFQDVLMQYSVRGKQKIRTSMGLEESDLEMVMYRLLEKRMEEKIQKVQAFLEKNLPVSLYDNWSHEIENLEEYSYCLDESEEIYSYLREKFTAVQLKENLSMQIEEEERAEMLEEVSISRVARRWRYLAVDNAELILFEKNRVLLQKTSVGLGNVIVSGCSLALDSRHWDVLGLQLRETLLMQLTSWKQRQLIREHNMVFSQNNYIYRQGLAVTEMDNLPNLKLYIVILSIYVLLIGPVFFVVFWKKRRMMSLWLAIPICSLCFTFIVYLMGTGTRIRRPYVNYLSQIQLGDHGEGDLQTWFRIVNGKNNVYETMLKGSCDVKPLISGMGVRMEETDTQNRQETSEAQTRYSISYENNNTQIATQNMSSFEGMDLWNREAVSIRGDIDTRVTSNEMMLEGKVTNGFSFDLEDCFVLDNGTVYILGDMKAGETMRLEEISRNKIYRQSEYNYEYNTLMEKMFGTGFWGHSGDADSLSQRKAALAQAYLESSASSEPFFYGFAVSGDIGGHPLIDKMEYDKYGAVGIARRISIQYTSEGMDILPDISAYAVYFDSSITDGKVIKSLSRKRLSVTYQLPSGYEWKGLIYNQNNNPEFGYFDNGYLTSAIFNGTVTMIDQSTGQEVEVLQSGRQARISIEPKNIGIDGTLTLYYYLDISSGVELQLPNIMAVVAEGEKQESKSSVVEEGRLDVYYQDILNAGD